METLCYAVFLHFLTNKTLRFCSIALLIKQSFKTHLFICLCLYWDYLLKVQFAGFANFLNFDCLFDRSTFICQLIYFLLFSFLHFVSLFLLFTNNHFSHIILLVSLLICFSSNPTFIRQHGQSLQFTHR